MSSMLEQSIIEASQLREAATENAKKMIVEKYASEVKEQLNSILEQAPLNAFSDNDEDSEDDILGVSVGGETDSVASSLPPAGMDGERACSCPESEEEIEIDFDELVAKSEEEEPGVDTGSGREEEELFETKTMVKVPSYLGPELHNYHSGMDDPVYKVGSMASADKAVPQDLLTSAISNLESYRGKLENPNDEQDLDTLLRNLKKLVPNSEGSEELDELDLTEELANEILETLEVNIKTDIPSGTSLGSNRASREEAVDMKMASLQDDAKREELKKLKKAVEKLQEEKEQLELKMSNLVLENKTIKNIANKAAEKLSELSVSNAQLYYTNRVLESNSLNGRQKDKLVEALQEIGSVKEAKLVFETMLNTVKGNSLEQNKTPKTITEALSRNNITLNTNKKEQSKVNPVKDRMMEMAGLTRRK